MRRGQKKWWQTKRGRRARKGHFWKGVSDRYKTREDHYAKHYKHGSPINSIQDWSTQKLFGRDFGDLSSDLADGHNSQGSFTVMFVKHQLRSGKKKFRKLSKAIWNSVDDRIHGR